MNNTLLIKKLGFKPKENTSDIFVKKYTDDYAIEVNTEKQTFFFGGKIKIQDKETQNITKLEDWVVLECLNRLLDKGYKPENISLEKVYPAGHGTSGRLDICVTREDGSEYLLIECKTYGKEFEKEFDRMKNKDGGQLFTYFKFSNKADVIMLYASELKGNEIVYRNEIVKIENEYRTGDVKDFYEKWSKLTKDNGVFDSWVMPYDYKSRALRIDDLEEIRKEDSGFIFNRFLEILRHNVVSDKGNAFNRIFTLFLCKIYDEKSNEDTDNELGFQWLEGVDTHRSFQIRLTDLYAKGMHEFLEKVVTDFSETDFNRKYKKIEESLRNELLGEFHKIRLEKNNEFAIKDVYDEQSFNENAVVVKEIVELLQKYKLRYNTKQQYLSDFFEMLLTTGLKQESGQFFTPVPVAQFIIKSLPIDKIVEDKLVKNVNDDFLPYVMDYAAGSGHFLTETMHEIQRLLNKFDKTKLKVDAKKFIQVSDISHFQWAIRYIYGIEKDYRLVKVGKVGCYLHGDGLANVIHSDGLARFDHHDYKGKLLHTDKDFPKENKQFDIIVSNPPYSVSAFKNAATAFYKADNFELYNSLTDSSSEIECLFVERTKQLLKDGGVAGIILPSSILSNTGIYTKSRELILENFDIVAITALGSNTFMATGTNTVVLFLRRRNNYISINLRNTVNNFFTTLLDNTVNEIEKPVAKYVNHVWENVSFDDYTSLLKRNPNKTIEDCEIYKEYRKKLKARNEKEFWDMVIDREKEKLVYFILAYPQKVVLVNSGEKDAEKRFLGYEFSNRRGSEGIHPMQRGKHIEECTQMFDPEQFENPQKASTYIYKAFNGDFDFEIDQTLQNNISRHRLVDMLTFDRVEFEKNISLSVKKKVKIESRWDVFKLNQLVSIVRGASPRPIKEFITDETGGENWIKIGDVKPQSKYITETKEKITKEGADKSRRVKKGDFILSNSMSFGRPYIMGIDGCIHDGWLLMSDFNKELNKDYFYNILSDKIVQEQFTSAASGGTSVDNLNIEKVSHILIPLPPKHIQEKIVSEIEVLEEKERKGKVEVEGLKSELTKIFNSSKIKETVKFSSVASLEYGKNLHSNDRIPGEYLVMGSNGIVGTHIEFLVKAPCIIVGRKGSAGKINFVNKNCFPIDTTFYVKLDENKADIKYFYFYLLELDLESVAKGKGIGVPGLNRNDVHSLDISLPPLSTQHHIVSEIETIEAKINVLEKELAAIPKSKEMVLKHYLE